MSSTDTKLIMNHNRLCQYDKKTMRKTQQDMDSRRCRKRRPKKVNASFDMEEATEEQNHKSETKTFIRCLEDEDLMDSLETPLIVIEPTSVLEEDIEVMTQDESTIHDHTNPRFPLIDSLDEKSFQLSSAWIDLNKVLSKFRAELLQRESKCCVQNESSGDNELNAVRRTCDRYKSELAECKKELAVKEILSARLASELSGKKEKLKDMTAKFTQQRKYITTLEKDLSHYLGLKSTRKRRKVVNNGPMKDPTAENQNAGLTRCTKMKKTQNDSVISHENTDTQTVEKLTDNGQSTELTERAVNRVEETSTMDQLSSDDSTTTDGQQLGRIYPYRKRKAGQLSSKKKKSLLSCQYCGKTVTQSSGLYKHIRTVHLGIRGYSCQICGAKFSQKYNLDCHMASHHRFLVESSKSCGHVVEKSKREDLDSFRGDIHDGTSDGRTLSSIELDENGTPASNGS